MRDFDFLEPATLGEAVDMLADLGDECRVAAGGSALILAMRQRMLSPQALVSLGKLAALRKIHYDERNGLTIGALARHADVASSPAVQNHYPVLASMAARVASPQIRHRGTIGGNLCYADPATDPPGCLLAHGASVVVVGAEGERVLPMTDFLVDYFTTALQPTDILREIRLPPLPKDTVGLYTRHLRTAAEHRPMASVSFLARRNGDVCVDPRLSVGASTAVPLRLFRAEEFLNGRPLTLELAAQAADIVAEDIEPISDLRGDAAYRRDVVRVTVKRTIAQTFGLDWKGKAS